MIIENKLAIREMTLRNGLSFPSDEELLMLILGSGTKGMPVENLARKAMDVLMKSNHENLIENLTKINGIGKNKALAIAAALELGKRHNRTPEASLKSPKDVIPYIQSYTMKSTEHFLCISLNGAKEIISIRVICAGSGNMAIMRASEVFVEAVKEHASAIILSHNHPSGREKPSQADIETTQRLYHASELLGISMLDHIIITKSSYYSFLENGWFEKFDKELESD